MLRRGLRAGLEEVWATVQGSGRLAEAATLDTFWQRPWLWGPQQRCMRQQTSLRGRVGARPSGCCWVLLGAAGRWGRRSRAPADALGDGARFMSPATGECASSTSPSCGAGLSDDEVRPRRQAAASGGAGHVRAVFSGDGRRGCDGHGEICPAGALQAQTLSGWGAVAVRAGSSHRR
jgi:hypothetical protein